MTLANKIFTITKFVLITVFCFVIALRVNAKTTYKVQPAIKNDSSSLNIVVDSVVTDREVEIDLKKLSRIATLHARGTVKEAPSNGLVVLNVGIDSTGFPYSFIIAEMSNEVFGRVAIESIKQYSKRYKIKPAIKDGKPIDSPSTLIPIVFDMTIFDKK